MRRVILVVLTLAASLVLFAAPASAARQFPETGYSVTNDKILNYFDSRGGVRVLGYPISREFDFLGTRVQFFQRAVLQIRPNGDVGLLNVLDEGVLPYTRINGSTFPAPNSTIMLAAPAVSDPSYASRALEFVRNNAPDTWEGLNTKFYTTFANTVSYQEAFPRADADAGLLPLINLEVWGLPISRPAYDPANSNFVYLRFQRGIMHFDKNTGLTQGILVGEYLKALITGQNLPPDLDQEARGSKMHRQYTNASVNGLARSGDLPGTNMFGAFEKDGVLVPLPQPTAVPAPAPVAPPAAAPPAAAPAAPSGQPAAIAVIGSTWYVDHVQATLRLLAAKLPDQYNFVRSNVYRIEQTPQMSSYDVANRTLRITEIDAMPWGWRSFPDQQQQWLASLLVHNALHIGQALSGRNPEAWDSQVEGYWRQRDVLTAIDRTGLDADGNGTGDPTLQFANYVSDIINGKQIPLNSDWFPPRDPNVQRGTS